MGLLDKIKRSALNFCVWAYCILSIYPLFYLLFYSLKNNDEIFYKNPFGFPNPLRFDNYVRAVKAFSIMTYFKNSMIVSSVSIVVILTCSLMFAYATARMNWRLRKAAFTYLTLGLFIPMQVIMIPLSILVKNLGLANTYFALIVPYIAFNLAFSSLIFYGFFRTIPSEMEESAFIDGASIYKTFTSIMLPLVKPAIATVLIFAFLNIWNEYTIALILISKNALKTLPIGMISFTGQYSTDWGGMGAAMIIASIPTILVYLLFSEQVEKALTVGAGVKG